MSKWGLIVRSETDRGLGIQTYEMYRNLQPDQTLLVLTEHSGFEQHPKLYPDATQVHLRTNGNDWWLESEEIVRDWLAGLDVVITVETFYDLKFIEWARAAGVRTIAHGNPEFWVETNPQPDTWWWPTSWRLDKLPSGPVVPVPVSRDARPVASQDDGPLRVLHVAGNNAMGDRNGTEIVANAVRRLNNCNATFTVYGQAGHAVSGKQVTSLPAPSNRWEMYAGHHVLVLPRRYGGLCLPVIEALGCGLAVIMSDTSPNETWPVRRLWVNQGRRLHMQTGPVQTYDVEYGTLANEIRSLAASPDGLLDLQDRALEWADANSWDRLAPMYYELLEGSC